MKKQFLFTILAFAVIVLTNILLGSYAEANGIMLAVATVGGYWNPSLSIYRDNRELMVHKTIIEKSKFGALTSVYNVSTDPQTSKPVYAQVSGTAKPDSSVVTVIQDFSKAERGIKVLIPHTTPLTDQPHAVGTNTVSGKGERRKLYYTECAINRVRQAALKRDNEMSEQILPSQIMNEMERVEPEIKDWYSRFIPFEYYFATFEGFSRLLTDSSYGLSYTKKSHPNSYVQGHGRIAWNTDLTFNSGYETNYATALATLDVADSTVFFKTQSVKNMVWLADKHKIKKINYNGLLLTCIMIHPAQALQLAADTDFQNALKYAADRGDKNKTFTGGMDGIVYAGALLLIDETLPGARISGDSDTSVYGTAYDSAYGTVNYGTSNFMHTPRDISPRKAAVVLGQGAITAATGKKFEFSEEFSDHKDSIEIAGKMYIGATRPDIMDKDGNDGTANRLFENSSSLLYWTYSPDTISI